MKASLAWTIGAALVISAGVVTVITPDADAQSAPFLVHGDAEQSVSSRGLVVRIEDAAFADRVTVEDADWQVDGNWLVVRLSAAARETEVDSALELAVLVVDGRRFVASERPPTSLIGTDLRVGLGTTGMLTFELPADLTGGDAELRLSLPYSTPRLDDVIVVPLNLDAVPREGAIDIVAPEIGAAP